MKCKAEIKADRLKDLDLGFYYCWVKDKRTDKISLDIIELEYSTVSGYKFFGVHSSNEEVVSFEKIEQRPPELVKEIPTLEKLLELAEQKYDFFKP